jgi:hypothetical protein
MACGRALQTLRCSVLKPGFGFPDRNREASIEWSRDLKGQTWAWSLAQRVM